MRHQEQSDPLCPGGAAHSATGRHWLLTAATGIDALVTCVEHQELMTDWDAQRGIYRLGPLQDFMPEANRRWSLKALAKTDVNGVGRKRGWPCLTV